MTQINRIEAIPERKTFKSIIKKPNFLLFDTVPFTFQNKIRKYQKLI